jgi:hypothetical protein
MEPKSEFLKRERAEKRKKDAARARRNGASAKTTKTKRKATA